MHAVTRQDRSRAVYIHVRVSGDAPYHCVSTLLVYFERASGKAAYTVNGMQRNSSRRVSAVRDAVVIILCPVIGFFSLRHVCVVAVRELVHNFTVKQFRKRFSRNYYDDFIIYTCSTDL